MENNQNPPVPPADQPVSSVPPPQPPQAPPPVSPPPQNPESPPPAPPSAPADDLAYDQDFIEESEPFYKKKIFLIGIVAFVVLLLTMFFIFVIFPHFVGNKNEKVTLVYWGLWEDPKVFAPLFDEFHRQNPNITIQYEKQDIRKLGKYVERLRTRIDNGTGPDLYRFHNSWFPELSGYLRPFPQDLVSTSGLEYISGRDKEGKDKYESKYYQVVVNDLKKDGAFYGIPLGIDTLALFVNNNILRAGDRQAPKDWDELLNTATHVTVKNQETDTIETSGAALGTYSNIDHSSDIMSLLFVQNGANIQKLTEPNRKFADQALAYYTFFALGDGKIWDDTLEESKLAFAKGNVALYFGYSWDLPLILSLNPNLDISIVPVPQIPAGRNDAIASYWVEGISSKTKHSKEAVEFLKFMTKKDTLEKLFAQQAKIRRYGTPYARSDMADLLKNDKFLSVFVSQAPRAVSTPYSSDTYDDAMVADYNQYLEKAIDAVVKDGVSVESSVDSLAQGSASVRSKYVQAK